jgi:hypothetical protein
MRRTPLSPLRLFTALATPLLCAAFAENASAQVNFWVAGGASTYGGDEFCLESQATITSISAGVENSWLGGEAEYNNSDWPWPNPGSGDEPANYVAGRLLRSGFGRQETNYQTHGNAFRASVKLFALPLLRQVGLDGLLGNIDRFVRPYLGVGVQVSTDGDTSDPTSNRPLPVFAIQGSTNIFVTYGISALLPAKDTRIGLIVGYKGSTLFDNEVELETNTGEIQTVDTENLRWGQWSVGLRFRL